MEISGKVLTYKLNKVGPFLYKDEVAENLRVHGRELQCISIYSFRTLPPFRSVSVFSFPEVPCIRSQVYDNA